MKRDFGATIQQNVMRASERVTGFKLPEGDSCHLTREQLNDARVREQVIRNINNTPSL